MVWLSARILAAGLLSAALARGTSVVEQPPSAIGADGAFTDCPCIDHVGNRSAGNGSVWAERLRVEGRVTADGRLRTPVGLVPRDYGSGECLAFDAAGRGGPYPACAEPQPPPWCGARWCYVDAAACAPWRATEPSQLLTGLHYSFAACGSISHFRYTTGEVAGALAPIHVFALGWSVLQGPRPGMDMLENLITEFMGSALRHLGFAAKQVLYKDVSAASRAAHNSSYTACVHDIAVGNLDLCVGAFWDTFDRRELMVPFASTLVNENIYLYATEEKVQQSFWSMVLKPTQAFSPALWGLILAVLVVSGIVMAVLEHGVVDGDFANSTPVRSVLTGFFLTGMSLVNAGSSFAPQTGSGKVFSLGFGFFILITVASFTANTATILIAENKAPLVPDLATALARGQSVCAPAGLRRTIEAVHPRIKEFGIYSDHGVDNYLAGRCRVCILSEFGVRQLQSQGQLCNLQRVGDPLVSFPTGVFVSERLRPALDSAITVKRADGTWYLLAASLQQPARCPTGVKNDSMELEVQHMTGNCIILGFTFGVAVLLRMLHRLESSRPFQTAEQSALHRAAEAAEVMRDVEMQASATALEHLQALGNGLWVSDAPAAAGGAGRVSRGHALQCEPEGELGQQGGVTEGTLGHVLQPTQLRHSKAQAVVCGSPARPTSEAGTVQC